MEEVKGFSRARREERRDEGVRGEERRDEGARGEERRDEGVRGEGEEERSSIVEIKHELKSQKVTDVSRFTIRKNNEVINTHSYLVTLGTPDIPKSIKVGYLNIPVKLYIPNPRRCTKCLLFGHVKSICKKNEMICSRCSKERHDGSCENPMMCAVCKGAHNSFDKNCPAFVIEKEIKKIQITEKIPYGKAKRKFNENTPQNLIFRKPKYSDILSKKFNLTKVDSGTQTDFTPVEPKLSTSRHSVESSTSTAQGEGLSCRSPHQPISLPAQLKAKASLVGLPINLSLFQPPFLLALSPHSLLPSLLSPSSRKPLPAQLKAKASLVGLPINLSLFQPLFLLALSPHSLLPSLLSPHSLLPSLLSPRSREPLHSLHLRLPLEMRNILKNWNYPWIVQGQQILKVLLNKIQINKSKLKIRKN